MYTLLDNGWFDGINHHRSPNFDPRPKDIDIDLLVIHSISMPPNQYGGDGIVALFTNTLCPKRHANCYEEHRNFRVSAHLLIDRSGQLIQFVSLYDRAWHAGVSEFQGQSACNDFSIGIELEGTDTDTFTNSQYDMLNQMIAVLQQHFPTIDNDRIVGHSTIAPGRKHDPGVGFMWTNIRA